MATTKIPVPQPGEGEPIVFFDVQLGGKSELLSRERSEFFIPPPV